MKQLAWFFSIMAIVTLLAPACTDPTEIGADLFAGDEAEVGFTDTLSVVATTVLSDTVLTYFPVNPNTNTPYTSYLFGRMQDPIFGQSTSQIYAQLVSAQRPPNLTNARLDSIVLVLPYNTTANYGDLTQNYGISVHELTQYIEPNMNYYSNSAFSSQAGTLGTKTFVPNLDSANILTYSSAGVSSTLKVGPQVRIPLTRTLGESFLRLDTSIYKKDSLFVRSFNGLRLQPTTTNQGMLSFNLVSAQAGIFLYYTQNDTLHIQNQLYFDSRYVRTTQFDYNPKGATVERYINSPTLGDSLLFLQGMAGVITKLEVPGIEKLRGIVINKAELELRIATPPGDNQSIFEPVPFILALTRDKNGDLVPVDDYIIFSRIQEGLAFYGGIPLGETRASRNYIALICPPIFKE